MKKLFALVIALVMVFSMAATCSAAAGDADVAEDYPEKPITIVVGFGTGGDTDLTARAMAEGIGKEMGASVVVTNMEGGGGSVGAAFVKDSEPDGYTAFFCHNPIVGNYVCGVTDYSLEAFELACIVAQNDAIYLTLNPDKYPTLDDYLDYVKAHPGETTMGAVFGGSYQPMTMGVVDQLGLDVTMVDIGGAANGNVEVAAGRVDAVFCSYAGCKSYLEDGSLYAAMVLSNERKEITPDVPTLAEYGGDAACAMMYGFYFPKDTPEAIIEKFNAAAEKVSASEDFQEVCENYAIDPHFYGYGDALEQMEAIQEFYLPYREELVTE